MASEPSCSLGFDADVEVERFRLTMPLIQAPMVGGSTPTLAAAVSDAGGLGSIGVGPTDAAGTRAMIEEVHGRTDRPFNVNLFVHPKPTADPIREAAWLDALSRPR